MQTWRGWNRESCLSPSWSGSRSTTCATSESTKPFCDRCCVWVRPVWRIQGPQHRSAGNQNDILHQLNVSHARLRRPKQALRAIYLSIYLSIDLSLHIRGRCGIGISLRSSLQTKLCVWWSSARSPRRWRRCPGAGRP